LHNWRFSGIKVALWENLYLLISQSPNGNHSIIPTDLKMLKYSIILYFFNMIQKNKYIKLNSAVPNISFTVFSACSTVLKIAKKFVFLAK